MKKVQPSNIHHMKLLYLPSYFPPEIYSDLHLDDDRFKAFVRAGMQMEVHAPIPTRGIDSSVRRSAAREEKLYGNKMKVRRFYAWNEGKNPVGRALRYFYCWMHQLYDGWRAKDVDMLYMMSTAPIQGLLGAALKKIEGVPFVYSLQDICPDTLVGAGLTKKGSLIWRIGRWVENTTYRNADRIIVISEGFKANIMAKGVPEEKIEVVYNWVDENEVTPIAKEDNPLFDELGLSRSDFHVLYAGNLGEAQYLDVVIDAAEQLQSRQEIQFIIFGTGGLEDQLKAEVARRGLPNVRFFPLQPLERVSQVYSLGDVGIVSCKPGIGACAMPSKTWTILSTGRAALVHFDEGELHHIIQRANCGVFTLSGDTEAFVNAITDLADNPEKCRELGANGRQFILRNLTCEYGTSRYVEVIKSLAAKEQ